MIASLRGIINKRDLGEVEVDVHGVGYRVRVSPPTWEQLIEGREATVYVSAYIREDRFDLFGFTDRQTKTLFEELIDRQGIGPKLGLELSAVSKALLKQALEENDPSILRSIKGIGGKTAEKLLIELKSLDEKHPQIFASAPHATGGKYDGDAVAALVQLGFARSDVMDALAALPKDIKNTEERVTAALRSL